MYAHHTLQCRRSWESYHQVSSMTQFSPVYLSFTSDGIILKRVKTTQFFKGCVFPWTSTPSQINDALRKKEFTGSKLSWPIPGHPILTKSRHEHDSQEWVTLCFYSARAEWHLAAYLHNTSSGLPQFSRHGAHLWSYHLSTIAAVWTRYFQRLERRGCSFFKCATATDYSRAGLHPFYTEKKRGRSLPPRPG